MQLPPEHPLAKSPLHDLRAAQAAVVDGGLLVCFGPPSTTVLTCFDMHTEHIMHREVLSICGFHTEHPETARMHPRWPYTVKREKSLKRCNVSKFSCSQRILTVAKPFIWFKHDSYEKIWAPMRNACKGKLNKMKTCLGRCTVPRFEF